MPYKDKCVSTCSQFEKPECNPPRCKYINGNSLKYCRLSHRYKMKKPTCNVTRRLKKGEVIHYARQKIGEMIKKSDKFVKTICSDSGICTAFGRATDEVNHFFKGFNHFDYVVSDIKQIGAVSINGFVKEISYEKDGYKGHAILKSSQNPDADNLVYEYLVGVKYINRQLKKFPCFVETYGMYFYKNSANWEKMNNRAPINKSILSKLILQDSIDYSKACKKSQYAAILIQHIKDATPMQDLVLVSTYTNFIKHELLHVLFIVYHALSNLSKKFTHYDLHDGNVLLYEPVKGKYIEYHYHNADGTETTFLSPYIPKLIDYGRSFFDNENMNSKKIYDKICSVKKCNPNCGENYGFNWLNPIPEFFISSSQKNESHDLRLLSILQSNFRHIFNEVQQKPKNTIFTMTDRLLKKVRYGVGLKYNKEFGTEENLDIDDKFIYNVNGAYLEFKSAVENKDVILENQSNYTLSNKLGDLHIYDDGRPMVYESM